MGLHIKEPGGPDNQGEHGDNEQTPDGTGASGDVASLAINGRLAEAGNESGAEQEAEHPSVFDKILGEAASDLERRAISRNRASIMGLDDMSYFVEFLTHHTGPDDRLDIPSDNEELMRLEDSDDPGSFRAIDSEGHEVILDVWALRDFLRDNPDATVDRVYSELVAPMHAALAEQVVRRIQGDIEFEQDMERFRKLRTPEALHEASVAALSRGLGHDSFFRRNDTPARGRQNPPM